MRYEYHCPANGERVEVNHSMQLTLRTWGELCDHSGHELGATPPDATVERIISGGMLALPRRVSKEGQKSDYDPVLHGDGRCVSCTCSKG
ncbi:MAG: hypothetical protein KDD69_08980 [Bdellovibrionales bacterium]|nr:hypothetical protein [Bdellovibrionales bacterium]